MFGQERLQGGPEHRNFSDETLLVLLILFQISIAFEPLKLIFGHWRLSIANEHPASLSIGNFRVNSRKLVT